jgi:hypothetical protein
MLNTVNGNLVIVSLNTNSPQFFWNGLALTDVIGIISHVDDDTNHIQLRVKNTIDFDGVYSEMISTGIKIKKVNN